MKKQDFSHLKKQDFSHIDGCFLDGYECWSIYLMFFLDVNINLCLFLWFLSVRMKKQDFSHIDGCQHQFMDVLWFLSVRMKKHEFSHFYGCFKVDLFVVVCPGVMTMG
jgi:hypothetical protein